MKVVLNYRVLQHWRMPVFRRLSGWPGIEFTAVHGSDFEGTKAVNSKDADAIDHRELWTLRIASRKRAREVAMPLCPTLPLHLARLRPDVILTEGGSNLLNVALAFAYAWVTRTPVVWWTLGEVRHQRLSAAQRLFRRAVVFFERRATAVLGYSSLALEYFRRHGIPEERQFRAVNCVDTDGVKAQIDAVRDRVEPLRDELGLRGRTVLLSVGALTPAKRLEDLIVAYARVRRRFPDVRLLIVGDGPHREALERFAREQGAEDAIFTGRVVDGVAAYFQLGDLFVLPGLGGLAISEAMTHGLPVLATEADGCEVDLVEEGRNGHLLPVGDRTALEACVAGLLDDPERMRAMGRHSRWIIDHRFNIDRYMENVVAALEFAHGRRADGGALDAGHSRPGGA